MTKGRSGFAVLALSTVCVASPVHAQSEDTQLEEITVTARKRTESLQEVPITVTAFTADAIERAKSTEGAKIRAALASTKNFKGISGTMTIGEDGNAFAILGRVRRGILRSDHPELADEVRRQLPELHFQPREVAA